MSGCALNRVLDRLDLWLCVREADVFKVVVSFAKAAFVANCFAFCLSDPKWCFAAMSRQTAVDAKFLCWWASAVVLIASLGLFVLALDSCSGCGVEGVRA